MAATTTTRQRTQAPIAKAQMLIRRPVADVFEAFVDPAITSQFWFSKGSGRLTPGARVRWEWAMYGVSTEVVVREIEPDRRILIAWDGDEHPTTVEWRFTPRADGTTFVTIENAGFAGDGDAIVAQALEATGGFTWVLAGLKALLEHGIHLNLVADHAPDQLVTS